MLPEFNEHGFLPAGVWDCHLEEFRQRFAVFRGSDRRLVLFGKLQEFLKEVSATGWVSEVIIDGSFVTEKAEPGDVDILLGLHPDFDNAEISFWTSRVLDEKFILRKYGFDVKIRKIGSLDYEEWLDFFQEVKDTDARKGVVRLTR